ncbi:MAG: hypothetical protein RBU30_01735 [Polyangia bacterium]|nr:hypothetical protein [Polyangia bacterium]
MQTGNETPNIYGVTLLGDRQPFERMYVGFTNSTSDFKLHRLSINASNGRPWNRTRILPVDSGDASHKNEVEFVQAGNHLYIFEGSKMHTIYLYY